MKSLLNWTTLVPLLSWILFFSGLITSHTFFQLLAGVLLIVSVIASVHHSEIIAYRVGEPFGTIILAVAITVIEVSIIISLMVADKQGTPTLARDTIFSATMLILNGIVGLSLFVGGLKHHEQHFSRHSATIALVSLVSIIFFTLILPSYTTSISGPYYSTTQLIFVSIVCLVIYSFFLLAQTKRHREYFLATVDVETDEQAESIVQVSGKKMAISLVFLLISLGIVVLLAKKLSPAIEEIVVGYQLPKTLVGVIIAAVILLPEGIAAIVAASKDKLQTSLNLALGSALASIGLTIPSVAIIASMYDIDIVLGLDKKSILLLGLSAFTVILSLISGRTNMVYGVVLIINLIAFIFLIINP